MVELTDHGVPRWGVLLVDMDYSGIERMMKQINEAGNGQYFYLCDGSGQIIYHTRQIQISNGIGSESSRQAAACKDGVYDEYFEGERRKVIVNTISYTGWKLVGVIPYSHHPDNGIQGIIEKMRIDLALQRVQFAFSALILL